MKQVLLACVLALMSLAQTGTAATLAPGESVDFRVDLSAQGALTINRYSAACNGVATCGTGPGLLLAIGESLDYSIGTVRGANDLFSTRITATTFNIDATSRPIAGGFAVAASVDALFIRVAAVDDPLNITAAALSQNTPFAVFAGVELAPEVLPVPLPVSAGFLLAGLAALRLPRLR